MWVVSFTPRPLNSRGRSPRYPLDRRLGGPQSRSGRRGEEKILCPNSNPSVFQPVASRCTGYAIPAHKVWVYPQYFFRPMNSPWSLCVWVCGCLCTPLFFFSFFCAPRVVSKRSRPLVLSRTSCLCYVRLCRNKSCAGWIIRKRSPIKCKIVPVQHPAWKLMGEWRYSSTILNLDAEWRWVISFTPRPLYLRGKCRGTHWIEGWMDLWRCGVQKNLLSLPGVEPRPSSQ
jgi:hypothetical protein